MIEEQKSLSWGHGMKNIRKIEGDDIETIAKMEAEIAKISFGDEAITDLETIGVRIKKAMEKDKRGMLVLEIDGQIAARLWMDKKENFLTKDIYVNFKSFYVVEQYRGEALVSEFLQEGIKFAKEVGAKSIVGKVNVKNIAMRYLYKENGFEPTHMTMEKKMK